MTYDQRDRPEDEEAPRPSGEQPDEPSSTTPGEEPPATPDWRSGEPPSPASDIESWPSQDVTPSPPSTPAEGPIDEGPAWPTEPPEAGTAAPDAWPTASPVREPDATLADSSSWSEPAAAPLPSEVEAADAPAPPVEGGPAPDTAPPGEVEAYPGTPPVEPDAAAMAAATAAQSAPPAESATGESATGESTQCPRCGTENRAGLAFCRNCGQRLVAAGVATTVERPTAPEGTMACPRCGTHNRAGTAFCQNCGANLRGTAAGYVPPAVAGEAPTARAEARAGGAVLGPVVLLIGLIGLVTAYLLPFLYGNGSLFERAAGSDGWGIAFWNGYPEVGSSLADQAYFGLAAPAPLLGVLLLLLAIGGFARATPGLLQRIGLTIALLWSVGLVVLFIVVELAGNWGGDLVGVLRALTPAGIIFFLASLIVIIGSLTRFGRS